MFHPWRRLRHRPHINLAWSRNLTVMGQTNGSDWIEMHPDQLQVERRCTLAHELAHIELEHTSGCTGVEEAQARQLAARWLIQMKHLLDALQWTEHMGELAEELWVDEPTLYDRLDGLTQSERGMIEALYAAVERGA